MGIHFFDWEKSRISRHSFGFSLLEMLIAVAIVAILAALASPMLNPSSTNSSLGSQVQEISGLFESARSLAVKTNTDTCIVIHSHAFQAGDNEPHRKRCSTDVAFIASTNGSRNPACTANDLTAIVGDTDRTFLIKQYYDLSYTLSEWGDPVIEEQCPKYSPKVFLFGGGSGFVQMPIGGVFNSQVSELQRTVVFSNPYNPQTQSWELSVQRSGVLSLKKVGG